MWGTATAAHQVEGNNYNSDLWLIENTPNSPFVEPSLDACDHYHRYGEDIRLLGELGFNSYRFSIEWARIEPEEGQFSRAALEHYRRMLATCHEHSIKPIVTFHHFTSPRWLLAAGGWEDGRTPDRFARYCAHAVDYLGDLIGGACTLNEPNLGSLLPTMGITPPLNELQQTEWWKSTARTLNIDPSRLSPMLCASTATSREVVISAHHKAVEAIKSKGIDFPVGMTLALQDIQAGEGGEENSSKVRYHLNTFFLEQIQGDDFVGVQTYSRARIGSEGALPPEEGVECTQMGYEFWPRSLEATIREAIEVAGIPVVVTENGIATEDDARRIEYVSEALRGIEACLRDGLDVRGYFYWSAFDNYEWMYGYEPKFGIIKVDRMSQERIVKPSAKWLGEVARSNGL